MKTKYLAIMVICCLALGGCNFSKGTKKNLLTGLSFSYNGFRVDDVVLLDPANKPMNDNKVQLNSRISLAAIGLSNYGIKDGKVFPGMMLLVTDKNGATMLSAADVFAGDQGHPPMQASELRGDITVARPMVAGETYHVKMRIWDKVQPENELNAETDLVVQ